MKEILYLGRAGLLFGIGALVLNILSIEGTERAYPAVLIMGGIGLVVGLLLRIGYVFIGEDEMSANE